jgi:asparagine synthase (glutamine-hydrolysing)
MVNPSAIELLEKLRHCFDQPYADSAALPTYCLSKMTAEHVKVALSGEGADELFSGYTWHRRFEQVQRIAGKFRWLSLVCPFQDRGRIKNKGLWRKILRTLEYAGQTAGKNFEGLRTLAREGLKKRFLKQGRFIGETIQDAFDASPFDDITHKALFAETKTFLPGDLLAKVDRTSMAHSLEARVPFLDHRLVEAAFSLPEESLTNGREGKLLLKKIAKPYLTNKVQTKAKRGFGLPVDDWFRGELKNYAGEIFESSPLYERGILDKKGVLDILKDHTLGADDHGNLLWALVCFQTWAKQEL